LRYRLYDIDRLINRTLVYGSLTAILGLGYAVVVVLGELLGQDTSLAVAGATLAMAAVFQPLRRRTQAVVDRRFNRRRHDAARPSRPSTPTFDQIDLDTLSAELAVVDQTMDRPRVLLRLQRPDRQALSTLRPDTHDLNRPSSQRDWPPTSIWLDQDHRRPAVEGKGRAFGACFAGKLRNPTPPTGRPGSPGPASGASTPTRIPTPATGVPLTASSSAFTLLIPFVGLVGANPGRLAPLGEGSGRAGWCASGG